MTAILSLEGRGSAGFIALLGGKIVLGGFFGGAVSNEANVERDVLIDVSDLSIANLTGSGDSGLVRALRRFLAVDDDEADVIAAWNQRA